MLIIIGLIVKNIHSLPKKIIWDLQLGFLTGLYFFNWITNVFSSLFMSLDFNDYISKTKVIGNKNLPMG